MLHYADEFIAQYVSKGLGSLKKAKELFENEEINKIAYNLYMQPGATFYSTIDKIYEQRYLLLN